MHAKSIAVVMAYNTPRIKAAFDNLVEFLQINAIEITICHSVSEFSNNSSKINMAVVVGGDGSILATSKIAATAEIPIIGVHYGSLGFLTDINPENLDELLRVIAGKNKSEQRTMLEVEINQSNKKYLALNEFAINRKDEVHLITYDIYVDGDLMCKQRADGVIVHTPTGSTAYALSAGGPILQPMVNAFGIVPLNPHRLNTRPIVIRNSQEIVIKIHGEQALIVSCDGERLEYSKIYEIKINSATKSLELLHPINYDYFERLRTKLYWEH